jgi:hypothetical protein
MSEFKAFLNTSRILQRSWEEELKTDFEAYPEHNVVDDSSTSDTTKPAPYLDKKGDLIIPADSDIKYHWWGKGQSILSTLLELQASDGIIKRYVRNWQDKVNKDQLN